jgi:hypothetical protein
MVFCGILAGGGIRGNVGVITEAILRRFFASALRGQKRKMFLGRLS